jgi:hypothetical protein
MDEDWDADISGAATTPATQYVPPPVDNNRSNSGYQSSSYSSNNNNTERGSGFGSSFGRGRIFSNYKKDVPRSRPSNDYNINERPSRRNDNDFNNNNYEDRQAQSSFGKSAPSSGCTETMSVESRQLSLIIGKSGATINNIKDKCGVKIMTPSRDEAQGQKYADIKITGNSQADIEQAKRMIKEVIESNQNRVG